MTSQAVVREERRAADNDDDDAKNTVRDARALPSIIKR
jgi:hypothetical protein